MKLKSDLKEAAATSSRPCKQIFDEVTSNHPSGGLLSFVDIEQQMFRAKRERYPPVPESLLAAEQFLLGTAAHITRIRDEQIFNCRVFSNDGGEALIFFHPGNTPHLQNAEELHLDATFKTTPNLVYQLLTFGYVHQDYVSIFDIIHLCT